MWGCTICVGRVVSCITIIRNVGHLSSYITYPLTYIAYPLTCPCILAAFCFCDSKKTMCIILMILYMSVLYRWLKNASWSLQFNAFHFFFLSSPLSSWLEQSMGWSCPVTEKPRRHWKRLWPTSRDTSAPSTLSSVTHTSPRTSSALVTGVQE